MQFPSAIPFPLFFNVQAQPQSVLKLKNGVHMPRGMARVEPYCRNESSQVTKSAENKHARAKLWRWSTLA